MFFFIGFLFFVSSLEFPLEICKKKKKKKSRARIERALYGASMVSRVEEQIKSRAEPRFPPWNRKVTSFVSPVSDIYIYIYIVYGFNLNSIETRSENSSRFDARRHTPHPLHSHTRFFLPPLLPPPHTFPHVWHLPREFLLYGAERTRLLSRIGSKYFVIQNRFFLFFPFCWKKKKKKEKKIPLFFFFIN